MKRTKAFPAERHSVTAARRFATEALIGSSVEVCEAVELMVSELATNCILHVKTSFQLLIDRSPEEIRVEVTDEGGGVPVMHDPGPDDPRGRGLRIVDMLSEHWGVEHRSLRGKTVWFTLDAAPAREPASEMSCS